MYGPRASPGIDGRLGSRHTPLYRAGPHAAPIDIQKSQWPERMARSPVFWPGLAVFFFENITMYGIVDHVPHEYLRASPTASYVTG